MGDEEDDEECDVDEEDFEGDMNQHRDDGNEETIRADGRARFDVYPPNCPNRPMNPNATDRELLHELELRQANLNSLREALGGLEHLQPSQQTGLPEVPLPDGPRATRRDRHMRMLEVPETQLQARAEPVADRTSAPVGLHNNAPSVTEATPSNSGITSLGTRANDLEPVTSARTTLIAESGLGGPVVRRERATVRDLVMDLILPLAR